MEYFLTLKDSDIFENPLPEPKEYNLRSTVKGIVFDNDGKVALLNSGTRSLFPGGGVEEGETLEEAFHRECNEEIGCNVEIVSTLGNALGFSAKNERRNEITFFIAKVAGEKGKPITVQDDEVGCSVNWLTKEEVLSTLENQIKLLDDSMYLPHFNCRVHLAAFREFLKTN